MVEGVAPGGKPACFASPAWSAQSEAWLALDRLLPKEHLARRVAEAVEMLDLSSLFQTYLGVGKKALRPDLLFKLIIYEMHSNHPTPAQWARDVRESDPVRWLLFGMKPSRAGLYAFRTRLAPFLAKWNAKVLRTAVEETMTSATRVSLDSSSVAAHAARRRLLNEERLQKRRDLVDTALEHRQRGETLVAPPGWLARSENGLRGQKRRYLRAAELLRERQVANARRSSDKRQPAEKVLVSPTDPEAILARDKLNVFRPLYNVQLVRDLDSPLIFASEVWTQPNDNGVLQPMIEQMVNQVGRKPEFVLADSGYVSMPHLEYCDRVGITLYGPCQENDFSVKNGKKTQRNQHTELPKSAFVWLPEAQTYQCPEGHHLRPGSTRRQRREDHTTGLSVYTCPAEHCLTCPRQKACTRRPEKGRSVGRMENEHLLDALRARMQTVAGKQLYKRRSQTVELNYADIKEHRGLRRFHVRGQRGAAAEVDTIVLAHNLLFVTTQRRTARDPPTEMEIAHAPRLA